VSSRVYSFPYVYIYIYMYIRIYIYLHVNIYVYTCICIPTSVWSSLSLSHTQTHTHTNTHTPNLESAGGSKSHAGSLTNHVPLFHDSLFNFFWIVMTYEIDTPFLLRALHISIDVTLARACDNVRIQNCGKWAKWIHLSCAKFYFWRMSLIFTGVS